ncbi:uncharacterized protein RHOBADRAFT_53809 [Rhodotorula graminis WP1]|uniref:Autophagy-related protein n=1 Tax=Rhodotorula graminis (strain WP1) TaxID=578459 RepID=A0A194S2B7_RHOGW|nr:uncharacterized protein RHOBADRAFT_53809 [Rhodotorula graminis WP1]KPV74878.1 hypothetical protein RHOBADRAFT_53809 [Rhodotorula graminis WP1]
MSTLAAARYELQVGLAPAAPALPLALAAPSSPRLDHADDDEAASLLPRPAVRRLEPAASEVRRLRRGFFAYSVASEVFVIVAGTLFLPVVLETYARENGRLAPDFVAGCPPSGLGAGGGAGEGAAEGDQARCAVSVLGVWVDTASVALLTYSASVAAQALTVISMGRLADDPYIRHRLLSLFALVGSLACIFFLAVPSGSSLWPTAALLALIANVSFGASIVCLNSYLPDLGRLDPAVLLAQGALDAAQHSFLSRTTSPHARPPSPLSSVPEPDEDDDDALLGSSQSLARASDAYAAARGRATAALSARAIAAGYAAGIAVLVALLPVVKALSGSAGGGGGPGTWPLRVAVAVSGAWWLVGSVPAAAWLRPLEGGGGGDGEREGGGSSARRSAGGGRGVKARSWAGAVRNGWSGLVDMLREWRRLPQAFKFLAAWFLLSDAFATITSTAVLFAKTSLGLATSSLIYVAILTPLSGLIGALVCPFLQSHTALAHLHLSTHRILVALVVLSLGVPLYGLVALRTARQMYLLAVVFGFLFGAFQSFARALYAQIIPPARASAYFALYSITDKSSSFLGPLLVATVTTATGEIRHGFILIAALMAAAVPVLVRVEVDQGAQDAERMDSELKGEVDEADDEEGLGGRA